MTERDSITPVNHRTYSLMRGLYARVARELALDPSYVSRVARGERESVEVLDALEQEFDKIARLARDGST